MPRRIPNGRDEEVVRLYTNEKRTVSEIATAYGLTRQRVSQILRAGGVPARHRSPSPELAREQTKAHAAPQARKRSRNKAVGYWRTVPNPILDPREPFEGFRLLLESDDPTTGSLWVALRRVLTWIHAARNLPAALYPIPYPSPAQGPEALDLLLESDLVDRTVDEIADACLAIADTLGPSRPIARECFVRAAALAAPNRADAALLAAEMMRIAENRQDQEIWLR